MVLCGDVKPCWEGMIPVVVLDVVAGAVVFCWDGCDHCCANMLCE